MILLYLQRVTSKEEVCHQVAQVLTEEMKKVAVWLTKNKLTHKIKRQGFCFLEVELKSQKTSMI